MWSSRLWFSCALHVIAHIPANVYYVYTECIGFRYISLSSATLNKRGACLLAKS